MFTLSKAIIKFIKYNNIIIKYGVVLSPVKVYKLGREAGDIGI